MLPENIQQELIKYLVKDGMDNSNIKLGVLQMLNAAGEFSERKNAIGLMDEFLKKSPEYFEGFNSKLWSNWKITACGTNYYAHPTAIVDVGAKIGEGTKIWHYCHIQSGAIIGESCSLGQNVFVANNVTIGQNTKVQNNVSLYTGVLIDDDVFIGPSVVFTNVINPRSQINRKSEYQTTHIEQGVSIGANATIICGNTIGKYAFVGAGAVVTKNVPDFAIVKGNPSRVTGYMGKTGYKLKVMSANRMICPDTGAEFLLRNDRLEELS